MNAILLVEDNEGIVLGLQYLLNQEGFEVKVATGFEEAKRLLLEGEYILALLDISLPDGDGFTLCRLIRERTRTPVIFLTAKEEEGDVVKGFDLGADDYVIKPFRNRELIARIRNVLRRSESTHDSREREEGNTLPKEKASDFLQCGKIRLNTETGKVYNGEEEIVLTRLEYRILSSMMEHPGRLFSREELLAEAWDSYGNYVNDNTLSVTMKRIREKIGDGDGKRIKTIRGIGYRLERG